MKAISLADVPLADRSSKIQTRQIMKDSFPPSRRVLLAVVGWMSFACSATAVETGQTNVPLELTFTADRDHSDPFDQIVLDVVFTEPDGVVRIVPAFWAGGRSWKVRYASGQSGVHRWSSQCSATNDTGLHGQQGVVEIAPYAGDNPLYRHGPIRVAANGRRFEHADGTPFFWLGDTWWMGLCHRLHFPDEFARLAANRREKGFNVIQLVAGLYPDMPPFDPRGANEAGWPWEEDYRRVRPEYFDAADQRLMHLVDQGFTPCIVGAWGFYMPWMGEAKLKAHWRYLVARYAAWPVVWCAAGEANLPWYQADGFPYDDQSTARRWCDVMRSIRAVDPWRRPLTVHPTAIHAFTARHVVDDPALLDFDLLQTPHDGPGMSVEAVTPQAVVHSRAAAPTLPVVNGEASYEMLHDRIPASKPRAMFWLCMLNGAAGHTYGANGIWQVNRPGEPHGPSPTPGSTGYGAIAWDEAMHLPGGKQIAAGKRWLSRLPWWTFEPHFSWIAWADGSPTTGDTVAPCGIGVTDGPRVFYMLLPHAVILRQLEPGRSYRVTYFDPVECEETEGTAATADHQGTVRVEPPPHPHDWVLLVEPLP